MKFDLKKPCRNCPFSRGSEAIRFSCRERAEEIEESAYRNGFPCHKSADLYEDHEGFDSGYIFGENTQYCAGAAMLHLQSSFGGSWPGINNNEDLASKLSEQYEGNFHLAFDDEEQFLEANTK